MTSTEDVLEHQQHGLLEKPLKVVLPQALESQLVPVKQAIFIEQPDGYVLRAPRLTVFDYKRGCPCAWMS